MTSGARSLRLMVIAVICAGCAMTSLPRLVRVGQGVTFLALLSIGYLVAMVLVWLRRARVNALRTIWPIALFLYWGVISNIIHGSNSFGTQNLLAIAVFAAALATGSDEVACNASSAITIDKWVKRTAGVAALVYVSALLFLGADAYRVLSSRGFALLGLVGVSIYLAEWARGAPRGLIKAGIIVVVIALSLSRLALALAFLLVPLSRLGSKSKHRVAVGVASAVLMLSMMVLVFSSVRPLRDRFEVGDASFRVGRVSYNTSGRSVLWADTIKSWKRNMFFGVGPGSSAEMLRARYGIDHPHNDYLRLLHDYGILGLGLWVLGAAILTRQLFRSWRLNRNDSTGSRLVLGAILAMTSFFAGMITDNALVYVFVAAPLGFLVGSASSYRVPGSLGLSIVQSPLGMREVVNVH